MLRELADMGMEIARAVQAQAVASEASDAPRITTGDPVEMFTRISRCVRLTLALEVRFSEGSGDQETRRWRTEALRSRARRKAQVGDIAREAIVACGEPFYRDVNLRNLAERLDREGDDDEDFAHLPTGVLVARICRELDVQPDWSRWADTDWAREEARAQVPGSPFVGPHAPKPRSSPVHGGGGPAQPVEGASPSPTPNAPSTPPDGAVPLPHFAGEEQGRTCIQIPRSFSPPREKVARRSRVG